MPLRLSLLENPANHIVGRVAASFTRARVDGPIISISNENAATGRRSSVDGNKKRPLVELDRLSIVILNSHAIMIAAVIQLDDNENVLSPTGRKENRRHTEGYDK
jgi:hypothetical protein